MTKIKKYFRLKKANLPILVSFFLMLAASMLSLVGCSTDETQTVTTFTQITMQDEFDRPGAPNGTIWGYDIGDGSDQGIPGWGNNELQYYSDRPENVKVEDGMLQIVARQESFMGSGYTSARILTKGKFDQKYGRFEARMKLPWGQGLWPAFWMLGADIDSNPWPAAGEIDIMENRGSEPTIASGAVHGPGYSGGNAILKQYELENDRFDTDFHVFGIEWGPDYINYYIDDVLYNQITPDDVPGEWVYDKPFYILINLAVGGAFGGPPNSDTVFPQTMQVDYVRVYEGPQL